MTAPPLVLVVEDEPRNQALVRATFAGTDIELAFAATVVEGRAVLASRRPDLVLLDLRLPDEPGVVLAREMRSDPELARVPILAVTASVLEADRRSALDAGCNGFVEKPISPRDLLAKVRGQLENPARD